MKEEWKTIRGYSNYQVSNFGRVKSLSYRRTGKEKILSQKQTKCGYMAFWLYDSGVRKMPLVHRLVAESFLPNPEDKPQVNHIDGDKTNNQANNLEWVTQSENEKHAFRTGLKRKPINKYKVAQYNTDGKLIKLWKSAKEVKEALGISKAQIGFCANGKQKTSHGFIWKYEKGEQ